MARYLSMIILIITGMLCFLPAVGSTEYFRYTDSDGVVHYTDSLNDVPFEQRKKMDSFKGVKQTDRTVFPGEEAAGEKDGSGENGDSLGVKVKKLNERIQALNAWKLKLEKTYEALNIRQQALAKARGKAMTAEEVKSVSKQIKVLNTDISAYEQDRVAYEKEREDVARSASSD